ncbi:hypothetical protein GFB56_03470 [Ensifer sp. T173]|jgi:hypothetical protein|uniref:Uncharacterized protein n=1 Tax=Ensifer canadensis TaxID=555315 RepID=A0AAW4FFS8_9HYPH|nr:MULTISPECIES: hypothetical protein [Ensifer]MDP9628872.1 hypothetical protein [Ensifer adhaerens]OMQ43345.1 hypothetical protein BKP54_18275 [Ensifer sp. 1H6]KQU98475.1 hypothetical protein ASD00_02230 [Ensifer sp. Root31]KQW85249.1 hypothetical protein ASD03_06065 [Ensifer sp. Root127]KQY75642.1 hypothetical protein ASD52_24310 [Ensifer sp. Root142]
MTTPAASDVGVDAIASGKNLSFLTLVSEGASIQGAPAALLNGIAGYAPWSGCGVANVGYRDSPVVRNGPAIHDVSAVALRFRVVLSLVLFHDNATRIVA